MPYAEIKDTPSGAPSISASGSVILDVKGSKIAIDRKMASKILFCPES